MVRFTLFGIPVHIHLSFWVAALLWGLALTACEPHPLGVLFFALAYFVCLLVHEMGHALADKCCVREEVGVCLSWMGGACCREEEKECGKLAGVAISLSGVGAGALMLLGLYAGASVAAGGVGSGAELMWRMLQGQVPMEYATKCPELLLLFFVYLVQVSVWWNALNLLPIYPLDGGMMMHELMAGTHTAHSISLIATLLLSMLFFALGVWALALLMLVLAYYNYKCILVHIE